MRIAIIGSGITGLAAASALHRDHDIRVFEADTRVGGHAHTVDVTVEGREIAVDTGFIVFNEANYPGFLSLLEGSGVVHQPAPMSFGISDGGDLEARFSNPNAIFAHRRNLLRPAYYMMLSELTRFNRAAARLVADEAAWRGADRLPPTQPRPLGPTLRDFLAEGGFRASFIEQFLIPFGTAIWSADPAEFLDLPAVSYARFMSNHGLLGVRAAHKWRTVTGGSRSYVEAVSRPFADRIALDSPVRRVEPIPGGVIVGTDGSETTFDAVIVATHSDQALAVLKRPTSAQVDLLGALRYQPNSVVLHTDRNVMPRSTRAWASWNAQVVRRSATRTGSPTPATVTYWMNNLQSLPVATPVLVTLNRDDEIRRELVLGRYEYSHPILDSAALAAQQRRRELNAGGVFLAGAYLGFGFHEDGVQAGLEAARLATGSGQGAAESLLVSGAPLTGAQADVPVGAAAVAGVGAR